MRDLGAAVAILLLIAPLAGCGNDGGNDAATTLATTTSTSSTTTTVRPAPLPTPAEAATHLYRAWQAGDRTLALAGATPEAVDGLFAHPFAAGSLRGCDAPSQLGSDCIYRLSTGVLRMHVEARPAGGYHVTRVEVA